MVAGIAAGLLSEVWPIEPTIAARLAPIAGIVRYPKRMRFVDASGP